MVSPPGPGGPGGGGEEARHGEGGHGGGGRPVQGTGAAAGQLVCKDGRKPTWRHQQCRQAGVHRCISSAARPGCIGASQEALFKNR